MQVTRIDREQNRFKNIIFHFNKINAERHLAFFNDIEPVQQEYLQEQMKYTHQKNETQT
jgi:hypothetical protein